MREVILPSGATLKITLSTFAVSKALYQAVLREVKTVQIAGRTEVANAIKDILCIGMSSEAVEACVWECFKRCTYNGGNGDLKIDSDTFEAENRREDYVPACMEVAKDNILPFGKSLYAEYLRVTTMTENAQT